MSREQDQVIKFYEVIWNGYDRAAIPDVLLESCSFRGSLGIETQGHAGFADYLDSVHAALGEYRCTIREVVSEQSKVFARMQFSGIHRGQLLGFEPTGRPLTWDGAALFRFQQGKISDVWVLGDLKSLESQLLENAKEAGFV